MNTIRCRNCGINYQPTATMCLRCMSPLEHTGDKTVRVSKKSSVSFNQSNFFSNNVKSTTSLLKAQAKPGKLIRHASPRPIIKHKAIPDATKSQLEITPPKTETGPKYVESTSKQIEEALTQIEHAFTENVDRTTQVETNPVQIESTPILSSSEQEVLSEKKVDDRLDNNQSILKLLEENLNIHEVSENDIFSKNGYLLMEGFISHLNLSNLKIEKIPSEVFNLKELECLDLSGTMITNLLPEISGLTNLKEINLHGSTVKSLPESLLSLSKLKKLNVVSTPITPDNKVVNHLRESGVNVLI